MSTPPAPTGPPGSWAKAAAGGGYGKSGGGGSSGEGSSPYGGGGGGGKGQCDPWRTTAIGIAWSKGFEKGMLAGKGKGKHEEQRRQEQIDDLVEELDAERFWAKQLEKALGI